MVVTKKSRFSEGRDDTRQNELVPARMLNEFAYCPRLGYLEWVQGEFADSVDTVVLATDLCNICVQGLL